MTRQLKIKVLYSVYILITERINAETRVSVAKNVNAKKCRSSGQVTFAPGRWNSISLRH